MARTSPAELHTAAVRALNEALSLHGCSLRGTGQQLVLEVPGHGARTLDVAAMSYAQPSAVADLVRARKDGEALHVLVADAIPAAAKDRLQEAGWSFLDRRGFLFVRTAGLSINDYTMPNERIAASRSDEAVRGRAGISAAALLLMFPEDPPGVREIARRTDMAPSTISVAMKHLDNASLLTRDGRPLVPELFWELAGAWKPRWVPLQDLPDATQAVDAEWLSFGLAPDDEQGWVVGGTVGAIEWGAPVVATADYPPDFYVPTPSALQTATVALGEVRWERRACAAAVALTPVATGPSRRTGRAWAPWPVAHPLFIALDLAQDAARGVETLADWTPPDPYPRVW